MRINSYNAEAIRSHWELLGHAGSGLSETRIFAPCPMVAYTDSYEKLIELVETIAFKNPTGLYIGVQPRPCDLFDLAPNHWEPALGAPVSNCASDVMIEYIHAMYFDVDCCSIERKKAHPASQSELNKTYHVAFQIASHPLLKSHAVIACSGNGHAILVPIVPVPIDSPVVAQQFRLFCQYVIETAVAELPEDVRIDNVYNTSRVMRLIGSTNHKGNPTPERPHRQSHFVTQQPKGRSEAIYHAILNTPLPSVTNNLPRTELSGNIKKLDSCCFLQWCRKKPLEISEPLWFAMISNLARISGGKQLVHEISALDMFRYDSDKTNRVINRVISRGYSAFTCRKIEALGFRCPNRNLCTAYAPFQLASSHKEYR